MNMKHKQHDKRKKPRTPQQIAPVGRQVISTQTNAAASGGVVASSTCCTVGDMSMR